MEAPMPPLMVRMGAVAAMLIFTGTAFPRPSKTASAPTEACWAAWAEPTGFNSPKAAGATAAAPMVAALARRSSLLVIFTVDLLQLYGSPEFYHPRRSFEGQELHAPSRAGRRGRSQFYWSIGSTRAL